MRRVSIILPTYNEAENVILLMQTIEKLVKLKKEILVVDDNSPDGTSLLVDQHIRKYRKRNIRLETRLQNRGLANSIKRGIELAKGNVIVWMDCDFSHPVTLVNNLLEKIEQGYDIAVCSRFVKGGGSIRAGEESIIPIVLSRLMNYAIQFLLGRGFLDYTSGFVAVRKNVFKKVHFRGDYGEYFIDFIFQALAYNYKIVEIPFVSPPRLRGESKTGKNLYEYIGRGRKYITLAMQLFIEKHVLHKIP